MSVKSQLEHVCCKGERGTFKRDKKQKSDFII